MHKFLDTGGDFRGWPRDLALLWLASDINPEASDDGSEFALVYEFESDASAFTFRHADNLWTYSIYDSNGEDWVLIQAGSITGGRRNTEELKRTALRWAMGCRIIAKKKINWDDLLTRPPSSDGQPDCEH